MTFFDTHPASYGSGSVNIQGNNEVETLPFLAASEVLVQLLDTLGSAFSPVKSDIQGNINKIKTRYEASPDKSKTLQSLVLAEKTEKNKNATEALLWLKRGLEFTSLALRHNIDNPNEELSASFSKAYGETLSKFHSFLIRPIFSVAMSACPSRANFYAKLGDGEVDKVKTQLNEWVAGLEQKVAIVAKFYEAEKLS
ncbi:hypothetical protein HDV03_005078 [Kappamyces sp. JEL0829]|nr:hypothetical protein HDV03_005078 [Kappamyces sp. JEL0829]KAJ3339557.1 hypothetical protein HDU91_000994 [Kappamyces sp. JEL0680]